MKMIIKKKEKRVLYMFTVFVIIFAVAAAAVITVYAANNNPMKITVRQVFTTSSESADNKFTYILKPLKSTNPMPSESLAEGYKFTINGTGDRQASPIKYNQQGLYQYELFQIVDTDRSGYAYYTFDRTVYKIDVYVDAELNVIVIIYNPNGDKTSDVAFNNSYEYIPPYVPSTEPATTTATTAATEPTEITTKSKTESPPESSSKTTEPPAIITTTEKTVTHPTESTIDATIEVEEPHDLTPKPTTSQPHEPETTKLSIPPITNPTANVPGNIQNSDEEFPTIPSLHNGSWATVAPELPKTPPRTGDESNTPLHITLIILSGVMAIGAMFYLFIGGKSKYEKEETEEKGK
jgi:flagellar basal body-associated protein FliL